MKLLEVENLKVYFPVRRSILRRSEEFVRAVDNVSFDLHEGETLGLVGESGCGKTTLGRSILRLIPITSGTVRLQGEDWTRLNHHELQTRRVRLQMIFQDPYGSLDPRMTVGQSVGEALEIHDLAHSRAEMQERIDFLLTAVGLDPAFANRYPHEFSGGQRQRIGIARAIAVQPRLIVCDEPVSALDVSVQAQIINLLQDLQTKHRLAYLFIAHDLAVVEHISHRVLVMYLGRIVEAADARTICRSPKHPYTQALVSAVPEIDPESNRQRIVLQGDVPSPIHPPSGCPFHPRCPAAQSQCKTDSPQLREVEPGHWVSCHLVTTQTLG